MKTMQACPTGAAIALFAAALLAAVPARAQGTDAQREACAPDAVKLCQDTIPDIPKTKACMKRHFAELSPACQTAFNEAIGSPRKRNRVAAREEAPATRDVAPPPVAVPDEAVEAAPENVPGLRAYEARIQQICREGLVDSFTCRNTLDALKLSE